MPRGQVKVAGASSRQPLCGGGAALMVRFTTLGSNGVGEVSRAKDRVPPRRHRGGPLGFQIATAMIGLEQMPGLTRSLKTLNLLAAAVLGAAVMLVFYRFNSERPVAEPDQTSVLQELA